MSISEISPFGLPQSLNYDNLPSLPDSCTAYAVNVAPSELTVVTGVTIDNTGSPTFVANNAGIVNQSFNSQNLSHQDKIQISIWIHGIQRFQEEWL
jgi:hypothetical protein